MGFRTNSPTKTPTPGRTQSQALDSAPIKMDSFYFFQDICMVSKSGINAAITDQKHSQQQTSQMSIYKKESTILATILILLEVLVIFMYGFFVRVPDATVEDINGYYPWLQDINVMILIGFGYLMTFLQHYGWSSLGYTFLINAVVIQCYVLWQGLWEMVFSHQGLGHVIEMDLTIVIKCLFCVASCLISMGAVLGRMHPLDLVVMVLCQVIGYTLVQVLIFEVLQLQDAGGSMNIHLYGAYFGLTVSVVVGMKHSYGDNLPSVSKTSGTFAFIGTLFLWMFWPSFNSGIIEPSAAYERQLAIVNTFLSLTGSVVSTFITSILARGKLGLDDVLNATLAGGVIIGSSCNLITNPAGALSIGVFAGVLSTVGFVKLTPFLTSRGIYDTCGINNLHGMPGFFGGIFSAIFLAAYNLGTSTIKGQVSWGAHSFLKQGARQMAGVGVSLGIALATGLLTGLLLSMIFKMQESSFFDDAHLWQIETEQQAEIQKAVMFQDINPVVNSPVKLSTFESNVQLEA